MTYGLRNEVNERRKVRHSHNRAGRVSLGGYGPKRRSAPAHVIPTLHRGRAGALRTEPNPLRKGPDMPIVPTSPHEVPKPGNPDRPPPGLVAGFALAVLVVMAGALWLLGVSVLVVVALLVGLGLALTLGYPQYVPEVLGKVAGWFDRGR